MKIRIKGNSIRLRLSKTEVATMTNVGYLEEMTSFGSNKFVYALQRSAAADKLSASFADGKMTMLVPDILIQNWDKNNVITFDHHQDIGNDETLYLLLEKDFQCIDQTTEDQSDNYINPSKNC